MKSALTAINAELESIRQAGTWREERVITTPQYSRIDTTVKPGVVNFCANNYLGLSTHPELIKAAKEEFDMRMDGKKYQCPIPKGIMPRTMTAKK